jgi:signal transduction histidine kinase
MTARAAVPARTEVLVATGCAVLMAVLMSLLPVLREAEPGDLDGLPAAGDLAWWLVLVVLVAQCLALAWRRVHPVGVTAVAAVAVPCAAAAGAGPVVGLTSLAVLVAVYTLATLRAPARVWPLLAATGLLVATGHVVAALRQDAGVGEAVATGVVQAVVLVGAPLLVAALVTARRESRSARVDRLEALEREQTALVAAAVARERTAMARELHDIAAHHLTGIAVMSSAIATQIDSDPAAAKVAVGEVRRQSTAVLRDLRGLVGLLRDHDDAPDADGVRVETLAGVSDLVGAVVATGQDVGLVVLRAPGGDDRPLGAGVGPLAQLAAYRTVQEALANAGRHAPGAACEVEVDDRDPAALVVTVRNGPPRRAATAQARGGLGLVGMRERAELTGSEVVAGPTEDGGWQVRLRTPRSASLPGEEPS